MSLAIELENIPRNEDKESIHAMVSFVSDFEIKNEEDYKKMKKCYSEARKAKNLLEDKRKEINSPFRKKISLVNEKAKSFDELFDKIIEMTTSKVIDYDKIKHEELRKAAEVFSLSIYDVDLTINDDEAYTTEKKTVKFKVNDISLVSRDYLTIDDQKVKEALRAGIRSIPGLEIYEETTTALRRK